MAMPDGRNRMEAVTLEELSQNAKNRTEALEPVVSELQLLNGKVEELIELVCELIKRSPR
jgi:hypothetical protein